MNHAPKTANATCAASICDQLWADGLRAAFVAPGSRSTPLALALVEHAGIAVEVFHDERSASFAALGYGLRTGIPALVLCSSGTAGAHFYAAAIEAEASAVPMIICTADRPPELWGRGAPQTINQTNLYGNLVRDFVEPGPPDDLDPSEWRPIARRLWLGATRPVPGPVHANLSFRDPLTGTPDELPPPIEPVEDIPTPGVDMTVVDRVAETLSTSRGVIIAGRSKTPPETVLALAAALGWPVLADHRSGCRDPQSGHSVRHFDALLRDKQFGSDQRPDVVLRVGEIVSSKAVSQWLSACAAAGTTMLSTRPYGRNIDPESIATLQFDEQGSLAAVLAKLNTSSDPVWLRSWSDADAVAAQVISDSIADANELSEITIAQSALASVPAAGTLVVSSSMPVRDIEWYGQHRADIAVLANRGANGIDGIIATAVGAALSGSPTVCLIGDVAFLHDASTLTSLRHRSVDLTIVVINNDGGGIFSFLPQHQFLDPVEYEQLFGTPHGTDLARLITAHGIDVSPFGDDIASPSGVRVVLAHTNRAVNLAMHDLINANVATALAAARQI